ncbi:MAG: Hint domain-containing protein [Myxococcota bacterium]
MRPRPLITGGGALLMLAQAACDGDSCFVPETMVLTPDGLKPIGQLRIGDQVASLNLVSGHWVKRRVVAVHRRHAPRVWTIHTSSTTVIKGIVGTHPVFDSRASAFRPIQEFGRDSVMWAPLDGNPKVAIEKVVPRESRSSAVFDLSLEGPEHNFIADGVLVHNKVSLSECEAPCSGEIVRISPTACRCVEEGSGGGGGGDLPDDEF